MERPSDQNVGEDDRHHLLLTFNFSQTTKYIQEKHLKALLSIFCS